MADELVESFRIFIQAAEEGATISPVSEDDLRRLHESCAELTNRFFVEDCEASLDLLARACSPGANVPAVWLRHTQLKFLVRQGVLADWQHDAALDDAVYRVAATLPMNGLHIDQEAFVQLLRYESAA